MDEQQDAGVTPGEPSVHPTCVRGQDTVLGPGVTLGAFVVVGDHVALGQGTRVGAGVHIASRVRVGANCELQPGCVILEDVVLGDDVVVESGTIVGSEGFGFVMDQGRHHKIPQVGGVVVGDRVRLGAGTCIDRGTTGSTLIGADCELGGLVQIGHNVRLGERCRFGSQVGLAGSCTVGDDVVLEACSGVGPHRRVGDRAHVRWRGGVTRDVPADSRLVGYPARPEEEMQMLEAVLDSASEWAGRLAAIEKAWAVRPSGEGCAECE